MPRWLRFDHEGEVGFGTLEDDMITVHDGDMIDAPVATSQSLALADVTLLTPTVPAPSPHQNLRVTF